MINVITEIKVKYTQNHYHQKAKNKNSHRYLINFGREKKIFKELLYSWQRELLKREITDRLNRLA